MTLLNNIDVDKIFFRENACTVSSVEDINHLLSNALPFSYNYGTESPFGGATKSLSSPAIEPRTPLYFPCLSSFRATGSAACMNYQNGLVVTDIF